MNFISVIKEWKLAITSISSFAVLVIGIYSSYLEIYTEMNKRSNQIELTQMTILKNQIKSFERYPCKVSRDEWAEYNMLFTQYYKLVKKHNPLLIEMDIKPMERLTKDSCLCYKGSTNCELFKYEGIK